MSDNTKPKEKVRHNLDIEDNKLTLKDDPTNPILIYS